MSSVAWCKSGRVPVYARLYRMSTGDLVEVRQGVSGRFYAVRDGVYAPGLVWKLSAELDSGSASIVGNDE